MPRKATKKQLQKKRGGAPITPGTFLSGGDATVISVKHDPDAPGITMLIQVGGIIKAVPVTLPPQI